MNCHYGKWVEGVYLKIVFCNCIGEGMTTVHEVSRKETYTCSSNPTGHPMRTRIDSVEMKMCDFGRIRNEDKYIDFGD